MMLKHSSLSYVAIFKKKTKTWFEPIKKLIFGDLFWGGSWAMAPPKYIKIYIHVQNIYC